MSLKIKKFLGNGKVLEIEEKKGKVIEREREISKEEIEYFEREKKISEFAALEKERAEIENELSFLYPFFEDEQKKISELEEKLRIIEEKQKKLQNEISRNS